MGAGLFPTVLGATLRCSAVFFLCGRCAPETVDITWSLRALMGLTGSLILFGVLIAARLRAGPVGADRRIGGVEHRFKFRRGPCC